MNESQKLVLREVSNEFLGATIDTVNAVLEMNKQKIIESGIPKSGYLMFFLNMYAINTLAEISVRTGTTLSYTIDALFGMIKENIPLALEGMERIRNNQKNEKKEMEEYFEAALKKLEKESEDCNCEVCSKRRGDK